MDERRDGPGGATGARDCPPASLWVDAVAWLGNLMYQEVMGEPYEDNAAFLAESPCDEFWVIGHVFDRAVTTLVVDLVAGDPDSVKMARDYMDGLEPPAWSRCAKFLETALEEGDFHDVGVEVDPSVRVSLQRLIDDIPDCPGERWGELSEASIEGGAPMIPSASRWPIGSNGSAVPKALATRFGTWRLIRPGIFGRSAGSSTGRSCTAWRWRWCSARSPESSPGSSRPCA